MSREIATFIAYMTTPNWRDSLLIYDTIVLYGLIIYVILNKKRDK